MEVSREVRLEALIEKGEEPFYVTEEYHDFKELQRKINSVLQTLTPREEKVIRKRFGLGDSTDHTLEEIGQDFEVTRDRIRQIEAKALRKLQHRSRTKCLEPFAEGYGDFGKKKRIHLRSNCFTFPLFTGLLPAGETPWPNIVIENDEKYLRRIALMVPFTENPGALLPMTYLAQSKCFTLIDLLKTKQKYAIERKVIKGPHFTDDKWKKITENLSRTHPSKGLLEPPGGSPLPDDPLFPLLKDHLRDWKQSLSFVIETVAETAVYHQVESLIRDDSAFNFTYVRNLFGNANGTPGAISFNLFKSLENVIPHDRYHTSEDFKQADTRIFDWLRSHIDSSIKLHRSLLIKTDGLFSFKASDDILRIVDLFESKKSKIVDKYISLVREARFEREKAKKAELERQKQRDKELLKAAKARMEQARREAQKAEEEFQETLAASTGDEAVEKGLYYEYQNRSYLKAFQLYNRAVNLGNSKAQYILGQKYLYGSGLEMDRPKALSLLQLSAEQGFPDAELILGQLYDSGKILPHNPALAVSYFTRSAQHGHPEGWRRLAEKYEKGEDVSVNLARAEEYYEKAHQCGSVGALFNLYRLKTLRHNENP